MSRIFGYIARYIDENLNAARVLVSLLLLTLVINASLLLAQYAPPSGFDTPTLGFDVAPASEEWGELLPNVEDIVGGRASALLPSRDGEGRSSSTVKGESRTPTEEAGTLEADVTGGNQSNGSGTSAPDLQPDSASTTWSLGLPSALGGFVPDGLLEPDYSMTGPPGTVGGEGPQAGEGPQGSGSPPASEDPQGGGSPPRGGGGQPASESPQDGGGQPASEGPQGGGGPHGGGGLHGNGGSSHDDGGPPQGGGGPAQGSGGPPQGGGG